MTTNSEIQELLKQYFAAAHALQSGVAAMMEFDSKPTEPKHMRTGINIAMADHGALVELLVSKGVITHEEYYRSMLKYIKREVETYEEQLSKITGLRVTLG